MSCHEEWMRNQKTISELKAERDRLQSELTQEIEDSKEIQKVRDIYSAECVRLQSECEVLKADSFRLIEIRRLTMLENGQTLEEFNAEIDDILAMPDAKEPAK